MGVSFLNTEVSWSYSGFMSFRIRLARGIGIDLLSMLGFGGKNEWPPRCSDPIIAFLDHSDCDGSMTVEECRLCAPRLREMVAEWSDDDLDEAYDKRRALRLADGMDDAVRTGVEL
jgi:hypothetical protein